MAGFLVVPSANAEDDLTGAVVDTNASAPAVISGLTNGTQYVAYRLSDASPAFTPTVGVITGALNATYSPALSAAIVGAIGRIGTLNATYSPTLTATIAGYIGIDPTISTQTFTDTSDGTPDTVSIDGTYAGADTLDGTLEFYDGATLMATATVQDLTVVSGSYSFTELIEESALTYESGFDAADMSNTDNIDVTVSERTNGGSVTVNITGVSGISAVPPVISWATNTAGDAIIGTADKNVFFSSDPADWAVSGVVAGAPTIGTLTGSGTTTITIPLSGNLVQNGETITLAYTNSDTDLRGPDANAVANFTGVSVTNNVPAAPTVPDAFVDANWSVATGSGSGELDVTIASLPSNGGATITDVEYDLDASGSWVSSGGTTSFTISGLTASTSYAVRLRAVNSVGNSAAGNSESATSGAASGVTDDFNRTNAALEADAAWTRQSGPAGTMSVVSNQLELLTGEANASVYTHSDTPGSANQYAEMVYQGTSSAGTENRMYIGCRNDTSGNGYFLRIDAGASEARIVEFTAGGESLITFTGGFPTTGQTVRLECNGTTIRWLINGVEQASVTDSSHASAGIWALRSYQDGATDQQAWDDYDHGVL